METNDLNRLGRGVLLNILKEARGGKLGCDPNRDPVLKTKDGVIKAICAEVPADKLHALVQQATGTMPLGSAEKSNTPPPPPKENMDPLTLAIHTVLHGELSRLGINKEAIHLLVETTASKAATEAANKVRRVVVEFKYDGKMQGEVENPPYFTEKVLRLLKSGLNIMLVGPAGSGKTTFGATLAKAMNKPFYCVPVSGGVSEGKLTGRLLPVHADGRFGFVPGAIVQGLMEGAVVLLDEVDGGDANTLLILNSLLANGYITVDTEDGPKRIDKGEAVIISAANTYGNGMDMMFVGRNQLDAAFLDRWYIISTDYDASFEASVVGLPVPDRKPWKAANNSDQTVQDFGRWAYGIREKVTANRMRRVVSTRFLQKGVAALRAGVPAKEVQRDLLAGWSPEELRKVGE